MDIKDDVDHDTTTKVLDLVLKGSSWLFLSL